MRNISGQSDNERLINWFVDYCQKRCGQEDANPDRGVPVPGENDRVVDQAHISLLPLRGKDQS